MHDHEHSQPHTAHTVNTVPLILIGAPAEISGVRGGRLSDIAPTVLDLMGLTQPGEMTGTSLLETRERASA
jgi:2,3-bisphosphoglycerate-independent phosphoglycerate mutase